MVGNVATEAVVAMLEGMGVRTGIDSERLLRDAGAVLNDICLAAGEPSPPSRMLRETLRL
jgi:hypothetical protein